MVPEGSASYQDNSLDLVQQSTDRRASNGFINYSTIIQIYIQCFITQMKYALCYRPNKISQIKVNERMEHRHIFCYVVKWLRLLNIGFANSSFTKQSKLVCSKYEPKEIRYFK